jgi:hypothetical protein
MAIPPIPEGWEFRLSHDRRFFAFYDPGNGPWFVPEPNMRGRFVDSSEMNRLGWYRYVPEQQPATDRAALRDRIAEALATADGWTWADGFDKTKSPAYQSYQKRADAVLAVLPAPTDRAALSDAERTMLAYALDQAQEKIWSEDGFTDEDQAAVDSLRRMADEAQPATKPEAHPPTTIWKVESPRRDNWASWGATYDEHDWARERYESAISTAPARPFRLVRATTTYTVEAEHTPAAGAQQDGAQPS